MTTTPAHTGRRAGRAFTLLEVLIAVAALGLIALGLSQIFRATGETVKAGRRLSNLNTYAALIESQLRRDFASMSREGFLVIRNEEVFGPGSDDPQNSNVPLYEGQLRKWRSRRADEIMFFATGDFVTLRPPVHPSRVARSQAARIYIGHGLRWDPRNPDYASPVDLEHQMIPGVTGGNITPPYTFGYPESVTVRGSNQFAADWTLLRHVTLLTRPLESEREPLPGGPNAHGINAPTERQYDHNYQIALQPAARSVFRAFNSDAGVQLSARTRWVRNELSRPRFDSGVVDIATSDLTEIRAFLIAASSGRPGWGPPPADNQAMPPAMRTSIIDGVWPHSYQSGPAQAPATVDLMQQWMRNALPVNSDAPITASVPRGGRMRYEPKPPNPLGYGTDFDTAADMEIEPEIQRADQQMLSSSIFVPGCSEFIVEWSFGNVYQVGHPLEGEIVWHGRERFVDRNADNTLQDPDELVAFPYDETDPNAFYQQQFVRRDGTIQQSPVRDWLIHDGVTLNPGAGDRSAYSFFGYTNPTYQPPTADDPATIPWPWPRMIRVTMTLVDPTDRKTEQTYQFIFNTPGDPGDPRS